jgi:murein DD-endopeptidase MepM/ murein hydrolase activator NlpD
LASQTQAVESPYPRGAFYAVAGVIATVAILSAGTALRALAAEPAIAPAPVIAPVEIETPPPPPAFVFDAPLPGREVNSPFGLRQMPWEENGRLHEGVDIAAPVGSPVAAVTDGVVMRSGVSGSYGRYVELGHRDGFRTLYAHLGRHAGLKRGDYVRRGTTVAYVGSSGRSTGAHLHFELRLKGKPLNPALFMGESFASRDEMPLKAAARVGRKVRMAQVSKWPEGVRRKVEAEADGAESGVTRTKAGRSRARIAVSEG